MTPPNLLDQVPRPHDCATSTFAQRRHTGGRIRRFILFHNTRHPAEMGAAEVPAFLTHLAAQRNVAASTQNQALAVLRFLYRHVLGTDLGFRQRES